MTRHLQPCKEKTTPTPWYFVILLTSKKNTTQWRRTKACHPGLWKTHIFLLPTLFQLAEAMKVRKEGIMQKTFHFLECLRPSIWNLFWKHYKKESHWWKEIADRTRHYKDRPDSVQHNSETRIQKQLSYNGQQKHVHMFVPLPLQNISTKNATVHKQLVIFPPGFGMKAWLIWRSRFAKH